MPINNLIGGGVELSFETWALSWVRRKDNKHSFLVLEGLDEEGNRRILDAHLVLNHDDNTSATIIFRPITVERLTNYTADCNSYTWAINHMEADILMALIHLEQQRGAAGEINYTLPGPMIMHGLHHHAVLPAAVEDNITRYRQELNNVAQGVVSRESLRGLFIQGHNSVSWSKTIVTAIGLPAPTSWADLVILNPLREIQDPQATAWLGCRIL